MRCRGLISSTRLHNLPCGTIEHKKTFDQYFQILKNLDTGILEHLGSSWNEVLKLDEIKDARILLVIGLGGFKYER